MKNKGLPTKLCSWFIIICLGFPLLQGLVSEASLPNMLYSQQSFSQHHITSPCSFKSSSDIFEMIQQVNTSYLKTYIQTIQDFGPHPTGSDACDALATYLYDTLDGFGLSVRRDPWRYKLRSGDNIEATLSGSVDSPGVVIVCAHYDSVQTSPGADDDGSGVSVILAVADIMSKYSFNSTVRFVLFSGEEQGLLGSYKYAQDAYRNDDHIISVLNLDGVGYANTTENIGKIRHHTNDQSAWMVDISTTIATVYADEIELEIIRRPHVSYSDHQSFVQFGYDASYLLEYSLNPYYHTSQDTLEHLNLTYLTKVCKLTVGLLASIADMNPLLTEQDLQVSIQGSILARPSQFRVCIDNNKPLLDSANVTISIALKNLRTGYNVLVLNDPSNMTCNWTFTTEITDTWEFTTRDKQYSNQFVSFEITVKGTTDDVTLYTTQRRIGLIIADLLFLTQRR